MTNDKINVTKIFDAIHPIGTNMTVEKLSLNKAMSTVNPVGKVAITTQKTGANKRADNWSATSEIPTGTAVLVVQVENKTLVKVIWEEKMVYVDTSHLRLVEISNTFDSKSFVITGELTAPREYFKNLIKLKGGVFKSAVSNNVDYLIVGDPTRSTKSAKLKRAMALGVQIITEQQFFNLIASGE